MPSTSPFLDHFSAVAADYASFRPTYPAELFAWLAELSPRQYRAWDCACGNGQASVGLSGHFQSVIATDASAAQIAAAPAHPRVEWRVATAEQSGLADDSVDLITVAQALHWFDLAAFYREATRVLRPNGVLAVWCYGVFSAGDAAVDRLLQTFYGETLAPFWPPERRIVERGYRDLAFPFTELAAPDLALRQSWSLPRLAGYLRSWSATARFVESRRRDPVAELESDLAQVWGASARLIEFSWPLAFRVGIKPA
ncbi:MAG: class I SAM-dependent methyltransferase [Thiotrichales bacterium]